MKLIAEIKVQSPFGFKSPFSKKDQLWMANKVGDIISVHTHENFGGSFYDIRWVKNNTDKPVLAKGFHFYDEEVKRAFDYGADYVLTVGRILEDERCWYEPTTQEQYEKNVSHIQALDKKIVWNSRDLATGAGKMVESYRLEKYSSWWCQASNITCPNDIWPDADAAIVGQYLLNFL